MSLYTHHHIYIHRPLSEESLDEYVILFSKLVKTSLDWWHDLTPDEKEKWIFNVSPNEIHIQRKQTACITSNKLRPLIRLTKNPDKEYQCLGWFHLKRDDGVTEPKNNLGKLLYELMKKTEIFRSSLVHSSWDTTDSVAECYKIGVEKYETDVPNNHKSI